MEETYITPKLCEIKLNVFTRAVKTNAYVIELDGEQKEVNDIIIRFPYTSPEQAIKRLGNTINIIEYIKF